MTSRTAFAIPAFRRLWGAGLISDTGDWLLFIALPLVVFQLTGSALGTSIAFLLELVPAVLLAPLAARLVGRFDRRWLMVALNVGQALALLPLLWVDGVEPTCRSRTPSSSCTPRSARCSSRRRTRCFPNSSTPIDSCRRTP